MKKRVKNVIIYTLVVCILWCLLIPSFYAGAIGKEQIRTKKVTSTYLNDFDFDDDFNYDDFDDEDIDDDLDDDDFDDEDIDDDLDDDDLDDDDDEDDNADDGDSGSGSQEQSYNSAVEGIDPEEKDTVYTDNEKNMDENNRLAYQYCGDNMYYYVRGNTLVIFGKGQMYHYSPTNRAPWTRMSFNSVVFRTGITTIGEYAFYGCSFKTVSFPSTIKEIGKYAFGENKELTSVSFGKDLMTIGAYAFYGCTGLKNIKINNNLKFLEQHAFERCSSLVSVRFPSTLHCIEEASFRDCLSLVKVILRTGLLKIEPYAFSGCKTLTNINYPQTLLQIQKSAFYNCESLVNITIGEGISRIEDSAFENCIHIENISLSKNIIEVGKNAFKNSGIKTLSIPSSLKNISPTILEGCKNVQVSVYRNANIYQILKQRSNIDLICAEHDNEKIGVQAATFFTDGHNACQKCKACGEYTGLITYFKIAKIVLSKPSFVYNGKIQRPVVLAYSANGKLINSAWYKVQYAANPKAVGTYKLTVVFSGIYAGKKVMNYTIIPKATVIKKLTQKKGLCTVEWKKQANQSSGYEIVYATKTNFSNAKKIIAGKNKTACLLKLNEHKKYYVRIRVLKVSGQQKLYSAWSPVKTIFNGK